MEELQTDTLYLAATRPAMVMGVPITIFVLLMMIAGLVVVVFKNPLYLIVVIPLFFGARALVSRDYNAVGVVLLYLRTAGRSVDSSKWGGASTTPFPITQKHRGRGMIDVG